VRRAILSHANYSGVPRESRLEKALFACDELSGFISACALVKPSRKVEEVDVKSVRKKMKDKAFARSVSREDIVNGAGELGAELDEHIAFCIAAMQANADAIGL
jgi:predicted hydrolase (HD superfamily)